MEYLPLKEYEKLARKILICSFKRIAKQILRDNDKFGMVVEELIKADWKYDPEKCSKPPYTSSLEGYRKQRILWILDKLLKTNPKVKSMGDLENIKFMSSINMDAETVEFSDTINDLCNKIKDTNTLSVKEQMCAEGYFINKLNIDDIANSMGIKKQSVKINLRKAVLKLGVYEEQIRGIQNRRRRRTSNLSEA